jgi:anti-anti-sigma factor
MAVPGGLLRIVELGPGRFALAGELDTAGVPKVEGRLAACDGDVTLDCSGLTFLDAAAVGLFVRIRTACETRGVKFTLVEPSRSVQRVLFITGLDEDFLTDGEGLGL